MREWFPDPAKCRDPDGIIAVSDGLHVAMLIDAYSKGIFPWPIEEGLSIPWFCPPKRGILKFKDLHVPRSLKKIWDKGEFTFTANQAFESVIDYCAKRPMRPSPTWITHQMKETYLELHTLGYAHSIEVWKPAKTLAGGIYGVFVDGVFSAESMFYLVPNASKCALLALIQALESLGLTWLDIQMVTPHLKALGAQEMKRAAYLSLLERSKTKGLHLLPKQITKSHSHD